MSAYLTDYRRTPYDFLATFYDEHILDEDQLEDVYLEWCEDHHIKPATGEERERNMLVWIRECMDQLTEDSWMPIGISEHAMEHWNLLIALAQTDWQLGGEQLRTSQQALDEYAGIIVFEDAELGDEAPLRVQFGSYSTSPVFVTDTYDIADVWNALGMSVAAAKYTTPSNKEN